MLFQYVRIDTLPGLKGKAIACLCPFCKGRLKRSDIAHYKLFAENGTEYLMQWDEATSCIELIKKP